ncbi:MAG: hypothetical protein M0R06_17865 [Sphaerochaeta sp.]|jgi:hypothetical protein|nr:hypothetical protein [Sphaerochaeta sp.]
MPGASTVAANLTLWEKASKKAAATAMDRFIKSAQSYAQNNRRWQDRTNAARGGLKGETKPGVKIVSTLAHTVEHGIYLELRYDFNGQYKILEEAISEGLPSLLSQLRGIFGSGVGVSFGGGVNYGPYG